jgi:hypothetical protein
VVRRLVGYGRFDGIETARVLARLYAAARLHVNFFQPSFKLKEKRREGAKVIKRYHAPATPYERALAHPKLSKAIKQRLRETCRSLDPVALLAEIRRCQDELGERIGKRGLAAAADADPADPLAFARGLGTTASTGEVRATHRRAKRKYKTRIRMPSKLDPHLATIAGWLAAEPQITALAIVQRLAAIDPDTFGDKQHSIVQRLLKMLRRKAAERVIAETAAEGDEAEKYNASVGGPAVGLRPPSGPPTPAPLQPHNQRSSPTASGSIPP